MIMELTGKCKEAFEKWYADNVEFTGEVLYLEEFYILPPSMQYGVYLDFFDSVGIGIVSNTFTISNETSYNFDIYHNGGYLSNREALKDVCKMRSEARTAAIEKANELFNKQ